MKILGLCGSPRDPQISTTYNAIREYINELGKDYASFNPITDSEIVSIPPYMAGCIDCRKPSIDFMRHTEEPAYLSEGQLQCSMESNCFFLWNTTQKIIKAHKIVIGSPVYLDHPTPQTIAFLTRLTCWVESTDRAYLKDKPVYLIATGYCSGTKTTIGALFNMCEMLGFTIPGRSAREYIIKWDDMKLRGGRIGQDINLPKSTIQDK